MQKGKLWIISLSLCLICSLVWVLDNAKEKNRLTRSGKPETVNSHSRPQDAKPSLEAETPIGEDGYGFDEIGVSQRIEEEVVIGEPLSAWENVATHLPHETPTHLAQSSGSWEDERVWGGPPPGEGAKVAIPEGIHVELKTELYEHIQSLYIEGALSFDNDEDTRLKVHTLLVGDHGSLTIGEPSQPISPDADAVLEISPIEESLLSSKVDFHDAMLVSLGDVSMVGQSKTSMYPLTEPLEINSNAIILDDHPNGWQEGDIVIVSGARRGEAESKLMVDRIQGNRVHFTSADTNENWEGFSKEDISDQDTRNFAVNISRNVAVISEPSSALQNPGRITLGGEGSTILLSGVGLYGLGVDDENRFDQALNGASKAPALHLNGKEIGPATLDGMVVLVNAPEEWLIQQGTRIPITNSVYNGPGGAAWIEESGAANMLYWKKQRNSLLTQIRSSNSVETIRR